MEKITYLVDTENVGSVWKILLDQLTKQDRLILFYTDHSPSISYTDLKYILDYANQFEMIKCYTGKNALDFQLVSYLGYLLRTAQKTKYIIISNDSGYDSVIKFWIERGGNIKRYNVEKLCLYKKERITGKKKKIVLQKEQDPSKEKSSYIKELETAKTIESEDKEQTNNKEQQAEVLTENKEKEQMEQEILESLKNELEQQNVWKDVVDTIVFDEREDKLNKEETADQEENEIQHLISKIFKGSITEEETELLISVLFSNGKKKLQKIYTELIRKLGAERGAEIYRKVKPHLDEFYKGI